MSTATLPVGGAPLLTSLEDEAALEAVGGKAYNLARLRRVGHSVPNAVVLTTAAFRRFLEMNDLDEAIAIINERPKPLALYLFTNDEEKQERVLKKTSSGGVCINDTLIHGSTSTLPFGGVGESGMGKYHGKASFDTFTHYKSVMKGSFLFDNELRYPPYKESLLNLSKKVLKYFG